MTGEQVRAWAAVYHSVPVDRVTLVPVRTAGVRCLHGNTAGIGSSVLVPLSVYVTDDRLEVLTGRCPFCRNVYVYPGDA